MSADRPLRILHCFRSPVGGIFRHVRDLAEEHARAGHQVGILCDSTTGGSYEDSLFDGIRPHLALELTRLAISRSVGPSDIASAIHTFKKIKALQPDVLHGHGAKGGALVRLIGSRLRVSGSRVARFYSPHGGSLHYNPRTFRGQFFFRIERFLERWTDSLIFVSDYERQTYCAKVGEPRPSWRLIHNGLRQEEFKPVEADTNAADFLYIGMMRDLKGPDIFIEALRRAEQMAGRPLTAVMVGDGEDKPRYQARIDALGLNLRVRMHEAMPARKAFAMASHVIVPSRAESMPYIVLEAAAAERAILATRVGGIPEILGVNSPALVAPDHVEALAAAMAKTIAEPQWLVDAKPDPIWFKNRFSAGAMAERMLQAYHESLSGQKHDAPQGLMSSLS